LIVNGKYKDKKITVAYVGIGGPSLAIAVEEMRKCGAKTFLRVGSCGSLQKNILAGEIIAATGAVREEGCSKQMIPVEYPAIPDFNLFSQLCANAHKLKVNFLTGIVHTKDAYFSEDTELMPIKNQLKERFEIFRRGNVLATDMETATLFVFGSINRIPVASLLFVVDGIKDVRETEKKAIEIALETLVQY
jgi:uridine phosphorylase